MDSDATPLCRIDQKLPTCVPDGHTLHALTIHGDNRRKPADSYYNRDG